jgi:hypothetical protein
LCVYYKYVGIILIIDHSDFTVFHWDLREMSPIPLVANNTTARIIILIKSKDEVIDVKSMQYKYQK